MNVQHDNHFKYTVQARVLRDAFAHLQRGRLIGWCKYLKKYFLLTLREINGIDLFVLWLNIDEIIMSMWSHIYSELKFH